MPFFIRSCPIFSLPLILIRSGGLEIGQLRTQAEHRGKGILGKGRGDLFLQRVAEADRMASIAENILFL